MIESIVINLAELVTPEPRHFPACMFRRYDRRCRNRKLLNKFNDKNDCRERHGTEPPDRGMWTRGERMPDCGNNQPTPWRRAD
ncbi:MAG: hypothetical protein K2X57_12365 [Xanthobacteraceae bacterium]|nr:hypothetical protein [Xanthobacteraceae bacterium]